MGSFHEDFLEDLRQDMMFYGERSVLCCYFREEKRRHAAVRERKRIYEETAVFGPYEEIAGENSLETDGCSPAADRMKSGRRTSGRQPAVEILCGYYDYLAAYERGKREKNRTLQKECTELFLETLLRLVSVSKAGKKRKQPILSEMEILRRDCDPEKMEGVAENVMDLYLCAEAAQFLYNAGYPLPKDRDYEKEDVALARLARPRIKTIPLKLLDFYFSKRDLSFQKMSSINRAAPRAVSQNPDMTEKIEELYQFVCEKRMTTAVIPLMTGNDSGSGLYLVGRAYLKSWDADPRTRRIVKRILGNRPCCYAIVKFLNLEARLEDTYLWCPYSMVDMVYESCDSNPEGILFSDLDRALNIYQGQLNVRSRDIFYENFHLANQLEDAESGELLPPEYRKYFDIPEREDISKDVEDVRAEYEKRLAGIVYGQKQI